MDLTQLYDQGLTSLKLRNFPEAVQAFDYLYKASPSPRVHEVLYSSILGQVSELRSQNLDTIETCNRLRDLITSSSTDREKLGFAFSTVTKAKISKRFKLLALVFHPDKGSQDAEVFVSVKAAYEGLVARGFDCQAPRAKDFYSDGQRKEFNDLNRFFKDNDLDEELNESLFEQGISFNPFLIFSLLPMIMLLGISIYSVVGDSGYSFERTLKYSRCVDSARLGVRFCYSPEDVDLVGEIEAKAEEDWIDLQRQLCSSQLYRKQNLIISYDSDDEEQKEILKRKLSSLDMSACEILSQLNMH